MVRGMNMTDVVRASDLGITIGSLPRGRRNLISDVPGVRVGHTTIDRGEYQTGVTVILPPAENPFVHKMTAAAQVINGFGKTLGLVQLDELGTLETPIALTGTLNVGKVHDALVEYMVELCKKDGIELTSINPVVGECNDSFLNKLTDRPVEKEDVFAAIKSASADFQLGAVGAGRGTACHSLKGGIGSSSRVVTFDGKEYTVGVLVQTNHGRLADFTLLTGPEREQLLHRYDGAAPDKGSCIMVLATDLPLSDRQLRRVLRRCPVGLIRLGSFIGHGSGEIAIGFSTGNQFDLNDHTAIQTVRQLDERQIDQVFRAAAEATEEAVLDSMLTAQTVTGWKGHTKEALLPLVRPFLASGDFMPGRS